MPDDMPARVDSLFDGAIGSLWLELVSELEDGASGMTDTRVGPWRLLDEIGRGGMGTVFLAERADGEFEQRAALKLLRPAIATDDALRRFEQERQILAGLTHPGIARLLDGGRTADGHPYLAMELVDGLPIDRYCRERQLPVRDRLAVRQLHLEALLVERDAGVEVLDGDADVVDASEHGAAVYAAFSARRISASAATPTWSCAGVGSLVATRRWISRPGVWNASARGSP